MQWFDNIGDIMEYTDEEYDDETALQQEIDALGKETKRYLELTEEEKQFRRI